jgi:NADPH2:quinone reductase
MTTMPALRGGGGPEWVLDEIEVPTPRAGQALVRVEAAGLNRADLGMLLGTYRPGGANLGSFTAGLELAGTVAAVGDGVTDVAVGDPVMGTTLGAFAAYAIADARQLVPVPDGVSWTDAAALPVALTTEHDALVTQAGFTAGQRVLVTGATSGVGMIAVQLAKALGAAAVIATTTSASKRGALAEVGADVVVDTTAEPLAAVVLAATDGRGVDVVLDHVGGALAGQLLAATRPLGTIINIGRLGGATAQIDLDQLAFRRLRLIGTTFSIRTADERAAVAAALVSDVLPAVGDGRIRAIVDEVIPFADAHRAADRMRSGAAIGKLVLDLAAVHDGSDR